MIVQFLDYQGSSLVFADHPVFTVYYTPSRRWRTEQRGWKIHLPQTSLSVNMAFVLLGAGREREGRKVVKRMVWPAQTPLLQPLLPQSLLLPHPPSRFSSCSVLPSFMKLSWSRIEDEKNSLKPSLPRKRLQSSGAGGGLGPGSSLRMLPMLLLRLLHRDVANPVHGDAKRKTGSLGESQY